MDFQPATKQLGSAISNRHQTISLRLQSQRACWQYISRKRELGANRAASERKDEPYLGVMAAEDPALAASRAAAETRSGNLVKELLEAHNDDF